MKTQNSICILSALTLVCGMNACGDAAPPADSTAVASSASSEVSLSDTVQTEQTTTIITVKTAETSETTTTSDTTTVTTLSATSATAVTTTAAETTAVTSFPYRFTVPPHNPLPTPGIHNFTLPADCPYTFDAISQYAKAYFAKQTGETVSYADAEGMDGDYLIVHLYNIEEFRALDYQYYFVDYHNLTGVDIDGNPVALYSGESTDPDMETALNRIDFGDAWGAALYLGELDFDSTFNPTGVQTMLNESRNAEYVKKYPFLKDIPESSYIQPVGGAKGGSQIWMIVPRPDSAGTKVMVLNKDPLTGNPIGVICNQPNGNPILLACHADGTSDCEITFIFDGSGEQKTFIPYVTPDTGQPACSENDIIILNNRTGD